LDTRSAIRDVKKGEGKVKKNPGSKSANTLRELRAVTRNGSGGGKTAESWGFEKKWVSRLSLKVLVQGHTGERLVGEKERYLMAVEKIRKKKQAPNRLP